MFERGFKFLQKDIREAFISHAEKWFERVSFPAQMLLLSFCQFHGARL